MKNLLKIFIHETVQPFEGFTDKDSTHQYFSEQKAVEEEFIRETATRTNNIDQRRGFDGEEEISRCGMSLEPVLRVGGANIWSQFRQQFSSSLVVLEGRHLENHLRSHH